jgi:hypothetical protein
LPARDSSLMDLPGIHDRNKGLAEGTLRFDLSLRPAFIILKSRTRGTTNCPFPKGFPAGDAAKHWTTRKTPRE